MSEGMSGNALVLTADANEGFKNFQIPPKIENCQTQLNFNANGSKTDLFILIRTANSTVLHFYLPFVNSRTLTI
jgi:hypothetical protein